MNRVEIYLISLKCRHKRYVLEDFQDALKEKGLSRKSLNSPKIRKIVISLMEKSADRAFRSVA